MANEYKQIIFRCDDCNHVFQANQLEVIHSKYYRSDEYVCPECGCIEYSPVKTVSYTEDYYENEYDYTYGL